MHSLDTDFRFPHALEPALALCARSGALPSATLGLLLLLTESRAQLLRELGELALLLLGAGGECRLAQDGPGGSEDVGRHLDGCVNDEMQCDCDRSARAKRELVFFRFGWGGKRAAAGDGPLLCGIPGGL